MTRTPPTVYVMTTTHTIATLANLLTLEAVEYDVENLGGNVAALVTYYADDTVTVATVDDEGFTVCRYTVDAWENGGDPFEVHEAVTADHALAVFVSAA